MKSLIFSSFFIYQKSSYKQLDTVVHHIFLPYFYRATSEPKIAMSQRGSPQHVLTMVYIGRQKAKLKLYGFIKNMEKTTWK